jgi:hypothetical protein
MPTEHFLTHEDKQDLADTYNLLKTSYPITIKETPHTCHIVKLNVHSKMLLRKEYKNQYCVVCSRGK